MANWIRDIEAGKILLCDGAMGTQLQAMALAPGSCPEAWCLTHPERIQAIHQAYLDAGCDIVETNTFGASLYKLRHHGLETRISEINRAAAALARAAAGPQRYVFGSMGPTGAFLEPYGDETEDAFLETFRMQAHALQDGGADAIIVETMSALEECLLAVKAAREAVKLPVLASMTFEPRANGGYASMMGVSPERFARTAAKAGADVIGANCGTGTRDMIEIMREMHETIPAHPLLAMPNAGLPSIENGRTVFRETPAEMTTAVPALKSAGVKILGGCCGTSPAHIVALRQALAAT